MTPTGYKFGLRFLRAGSRKGDVGDDISPVTQDFEPHCPPSNPEGDSCARGLLKESSQESRERQQGDQVRRGDGAEQGVASVESVPGLILQGTLSVFNTVESVPL